MHSAALPTLPGHRILPYAALVVLGLCLSLSTQATDCRSKTVAADEPGQFCDEQGGMYRLGPTAIDAASVSTAEAVVVAGSTSDVVQIQFDDSGTTVFAALTAALVRKGPPRNQLAIVVDRTVVSAPEVQEEITSGMAQIVGGFTAAEAQALADRLQPTG
ncbi:MAG: hypothetical protein WAN48_11220 [Actinomycetes bacterium]